METLEYSRRFSLFKGRGHTLWCSGITLDLVLMLVTTPPGQLFWHVGSMGKWWWSGVAPPGLCWRAVPTSPRHAHLSAHFTHAHLSPRLHSSEELLRGELVPKRGHLCEPVGDLPVHLPTAIWGQEL